MLKTTESFDKLVFGRNNSSRPVSCKNNDSRLAFERNDGDGKINRFGIIDNNGKLSYC